MKKLEDFLKPTQKELFGQLRRMYPNAVVNKGAYILVPGDAPVLLIAHLDTVHKEPVRQVCKTAEGNILMSPQGIGGDDRCGVYALVTAHTQSRKKPWLLFTCDEEIGGIGARTFCKNYSNKKLPKELGKMKLLIEIDRKGQTDAVYYECDNPDFEKYISSKGFVTQYGTFSDISYIAPELGVAAVNLSSGYYNAHTQHEYINREHLNATVQKVVEIIADAVKPELPVYAYMERAWPGKGTRLSLLEDDWENPDLDGVSEEIRPEFEALLDMFSPDELNAIRKENGDWAIRELYVAEIGQYCADIPTSDESDTHMRGAWIW